MSYLSELALTKWRMPGNLIQCSYTLFKSQKGLVDFGSFQPTHAHIRSQYLQKNIHIKMAFHLVLLSASPRSAPRSLPAKSMNENSPTCFRLPPR